MAQTFRYPAGASVSIPAIGTNGATAPTQSIEVAGINPSGNLQPLQTDAGGNLLVSGITAGGVTANQGTPNTIANAWPVKITDGTNTLALTGTSINVNVTASALPTGAATSSLQTTGNTSLSSIDSKTPALGQ